MPTRLSQRAERLVPLALVLLFAGGWLAWTGYWLDDAFIFFRYARNLAEGHGPVFNPGEAVEGYTSFLWVLLCAIPFALLPERLAPLAIDGAGAALGAFVLLRAYRFPGPAGETRRRPLLLLLAVHPVFVVNCSDGMETPLFMALFMECLRATRRPPSLQAGAITGALTAACALTRPEALPLLAVLPGLQGLRREPVGRFAVGFAAAGLGPVLLHQLWRLGYYGAALPNTFYAKAAGPLGPRLHTGLEDVASFAAGAGEVPDLSLWLAGALALAATVRGASAARGGGADGPARRHWWALLWMAVGFRVAFDLWSGSEYMGSFRFLAPALPPLFVMADEGARGLPLPGRRGVAALALVAGLAGVLGSHSLLRAREPYREGLEAAHVALGRWLAEEKAGDTWMAIGDAGAVPFFSRLPTIDLWGLADAHIARRPGRYGDRPGVADYVLGREPGLIVLWNLRPIRGRSAEAERLRVLGAWPFDREIAEHPDFARRYRFVREFRFREAGPPDGHGYYLDVFERLPGTDRSGS